MNFRSIALITLIGAALAAPVLAQVFAGVDEGGAIAGDIAHARGRALVAAAVDPAGVLAAGHLQAPGRAGELHPLHRARGRPREKRAGDCPS